MANNLQFSDPGSHALLRLDLRQFVGVAGSNPAEGMDVRLLCLLCVV